MMMSKSVMGGSVMKLAEPCPRGPGHAGICRILARRTPWSASSRLIATKFNQTVGHIVGLIDFYTLQRPLSLDPAGSIAVARIAAVGATSPLVAASGNYRCPPALAAYGL